MLKTFKGGMHIPDHKEETNDIPVKKLAGAPIHIFPLQQHIGARLNPVVSVGDYVKVGQMIADSDAFLSAPIHSSISGTVIDIKPCLHPSGAEVTAIYVENDFKDETAKTVVPVKPEGMSKKDIIHVIRMAGIVGMGGAGFPTHIKLSPSEDKKITDVIINAAECEPYLTADHRRLLESPEDVLYGLKVCMDLFGLEKGRIAIEVNKQDAINLLSEKKDDSVEIVSLKTKYPQGGEKQIIKAVTGKSVPMGGLPADVGAIVINVDTAYAIANAFKKGIPAISRIITVAGDCVKNPCNIEVKLGTPIEYVLEAAGGLSENAKKLIMGGPMMGTALYSTQIPTIKTTSALLAFSEAASVFDKDSTCIRCGKCVKACPMHLMPLQLAKYAAAGDLDKCEEYNILNCIECGLCSYLCPGKRGPVQQIRLAKQKIIERKRAQR